MEERWEKAAFRAWLEQHAGDAMVGVANTLSCCPVAAWRVALTGQSCLVSGLYAVRGLPDWDERRKVLLPAWVRDFVSVLDHGCGGEEVVVTAAQALAVLACVEGGEHNG